MTAPSCTVRKTVVSPLPADDFDSPVWRAAETVTLDNRYLGNVPEHGFTPRVSCRLLHGNGYIFGRFRVEDHYILIRAKKDQDCVCTDSCVEFFVRPQNNVRYYNFEFSAGTAMLLYSCTDLRRGVYTPIPLEDCASVIRASTLPRSVDPESTDPVTWQFFFAVPVSFFTKFGDNVSADLSGQVWTANFTKCADHTSHPCWLSWQPLPVLDFHQPECFGKIFFE